MGPVASVVVARSECPVLTVPAHPTARTTEVGLFSRIVCAVDPLAFVPRRHSAGPVTRVGDRGTPDLRLCCPGGQFNSLFADS